MGVNDWDQALILNGINQVNMCPSTGGGYNVFTNNRTHIKLNHSQIPIANNGGNSFGSHGTFCFEGSVIDVLDNSWDLSGNYFLPTTLGSSIGGNVQASNIINSNTQEFLSVNAFTVENYMMLCPDEPISVANGKSLIMNSTFDALGRESNKREIGFIGIQLNNEGRLNNPLTLIQK